MSNPAYISFERFLNVRAAGGANFHPDGDRIAFVTDITGVPQVWAISTQGGWPEQRSFERERVNFLRYAPQDGRLIYGMDVGGNELQQLYLLSADGAQVRNLTNRPDAMHYWGGWSADGKTLAFASNRRDPRFFDIYTGDLDTGAIQCVYQADASTYCGPFSPDGRSLVLVRVHGSMDEDLWLLDLDSGVARPITPHQGKALYESVNWAVDGQGLYLITDQGRDTTALAYLDLASGRWRWLDTPEWDVEEASLAPNGRLLAYAVNIEGRSELRVLDVTTGQSVAVPHSLPTGVIGVLPVCRDPRGARAITWSPDSRCLAVSLSSGTQTPNVWLVEVGEERGDREPGRQGREGREASPREGAWVSPSFAGEGADLPPPPPSLAGKGEEITPPFAGEGPGEGSGEGSLSGKGSGAGCWRLTHSTLAGIPQTELVEPEVIRYPTFDGRLIPGLYYRPSSHASDGSGGALPVVVYVHGGPEAQSRPAFNTVIAYFVHRGYAVFAPNVRGSTGYGRAYSHLDDVEKRMDSVADLKYAVEWLVAFGGADPKRIAVMGGSYGGFMVLAAVTTYPELWAAGVDLVGIGNFVTFMERTSPYRRKHRASEYGSLEQHRDVLERISPIHKVDRITAPMIILHGANDPRVPIFEAEQMVASLRARQRPVEYLRFEDEGHGIVKLTNKLVAYPAIGDFLDRHLGESP